jgi:hypothetical protein
MVFMLSVFLLSLGSNISAEGEVSIMDALDSGDISARFASKGAASGHVADLVIESNAVSDITLDLANSGLEGMVLVNPYDEEQDEVITGTPGTTSQGVFYPKDNVTLGPDKSVTVPVIGYCMNFDLDTPSISIEFDLSITSQKTSINEISPIVDTIETYEFPDDWSTGHVQKVEQMAIWTSQQDNRNVPLSKYSDRGYTLSEEDIVIVRDIHNLSGKDTSDVAALTGIEKEDEGSGILEDIPWFVILLIIVPIIIVGISGSVNRARKKKRRKGPPRTRLSAIEYYHRKKEECEKLNRKCKEAYRKAREAEDWAKKVNEKLKEVESKSDKTKKERERAELEFEEFEMDREEKEESWAESDGTRITFYDLKLKNEASKTLWQQYQNGEIDVQTLQKVWEDLGEEEALKELRKKDKKDQEIPLKDALEQAMWNEAEAKSAAVKAQKEAASVSDYARKARDYSNKVCRKAHQCQETVKTAAKAAGIKPSEKATSSKVKGTEKKPPEKEGGLHEESKEPEELDIENDEEDKKDEDDNKVETEIGSLENPLLDKNPECSEDKDSTE